MEVLSIILRITHYGFAVIAIVYIISQRKLTKDKLKTVVLPLSICMLIITIIRILVSHYAGI